MTSSASNLLGKKFGRLTVVRRDGSNLQRRAIWLCLCDCGKSTKASGDNLKRGLHLSCGCLQKEAVSTHGHAASSRKPSSPTYCSWQNMKARCTNPNNIAYKNYGGRGITVCQRWLDNFENFLADMGERPKGRTIDRKDNNGNYEPSNCRWATQRQQHSNKRQKE